MCRLPVLAALTVAALIAASAWLTIVAQSDPEPLPVPQQQPRDDDQAQQQESQSEPEPGQPEEGEDEAAEQQPSDEEASEASSEEEDSEPADEPEPLPDPADVLIAALSVERPPLPEAAPDPVQTAPIPTTTISVETYIVEPGDTLSEIADRLEVDLHELIAANMLDSPDLIHIGQELAIPVETEVEFEEPEPVEEAEPPPEPVEVVSAVTENGIVYGTIHDHERGAIDSAIVALARLDTSIRLVEACVDGVQRTYITGLQVADGLTRVYWRFHDSPLNTDRWTAFADRIESNRGYSFFRTAGEEMAAHALWIRIDGFDLTFDVGDPLPEDMRYNFSICARACSHLGDVVSE